MLENMFNINIPQAQKTADEEKARKKRLKEEKRRLKEERYAAKRLLVVRALTASPHRNDD